MNRSLLLPITCLLLACSSRSSTEADASDFAGLEDLTQDVADEYSAGEVTPTSDVMDLEGLFDAVGEVSVDAVEEPAMKSLPHALCGAPDYSFLDAGDLGELLDYEPIPFWSLPASVLDALLAAAEFTALSPLPYGVQAYRFRYTTQDRGLAVEATALLALPTWEDEQPRGPFPMVLNTHGTTGFSDPCAPTRPDRELEDPAIPCAMAALGSVVVAPDYIGMCGFGAPATVRHAYLVGEQIGMGSWDAVRAGRKLVEALGNPVEMTSQVVPWGASQGGHAALFAALYAPYYAPEFEVPAVAAMVPPIDLVSLLEYFSQDVGSGTGLLAVSLTAMHLWYESGADLGEVFANEDPLWIADNISEAIYPLDECEIDLPIDSHDATIDMLFVESFRSLVAQGAFPDFEPWACFYAENSLTSSSVPVLKHPPTLMVYGEDDDLVVTYLQRPAFESLCSQGYQLQYMECAQAGHVEASLWSLPEQWVWIQDRLEGIAVPEGQQCIITQPTCCSGGPEGSCDG